MPFVLAVYPLIILSQALVFSIACMGLNLLFGSAGSFSLGHATFFGVAAYTGAFLYRFYAALQLSSDFSAASCKPMLDITITSDHTDHWTKMLRSLALSSGPEASVHTQSLADSITTTFGFRFSVHTGFLYA
jgi:ABC-type branched-subunit amino acid transport system permease subunit